MKVLMEQEFPFTPEYYPECGKEWGNYEAWVQHRWEQESKELTGNSKD
jgi:hypothetical protein